MQQLVKCQTLAYHIQVGEYSQIESHLKEFVNPGIEQFKFVGNGQTGN